MWVLGNTFGPPARALCPHNHWASVQPCVEFYEKTKKITYWELHICFPLKTRGTWERTGSRGKESDLKQKLANLSFLTGDRKTRIVCWVTQFKYTLKDFFSMSPITNLFLILLLVWPDKCRVHFNSYYGFWCLLSVHSNFGEYSSNQVLSGLQVNNVLTGFYVSSFIKWVTVAARILNMTSLSFTFDFVFWGLQGLLDHSCAFKNYSY